MAASTTKRGFSARDWLAAVLAASLALSGSGCADQQNQKTVFGALGGGALASGACLLAKGNALTCTLVGLAGAVAGGAIGHHYDERDRARREEAMRQALADQRLWQALPPPVVPAAPAAAPAPDVQQTAPPEAKPAKPAASRQVAWRNPSTNDSGTITPLRTFASPQAAAPCKEFEEDYVREGKTYTDTLQACPNAAGTGFDIKPVS